jgi:hypothetical protein
MIWVFDTTSMQCIKDTLLSTSKIDGLSYAKEGGPRRARVPKSVFELQGSFSNIYGLDVCISGSSRAIACPETTMETKWTVPGLFMVTLYFTNTTSLKAWQWVGCCSASASVSLCSDGQAVAMGLREASEW